MGRGSRFGNVLAAHVRTWRPYTLWYVGLVGLAGAALAADRHTPGRLAAAWLVPTLVWLAAHYLGDYLDRDLDAISKPQRPIPSGRLRPSTAVVCGVVLTCGGLAVGLSVNGLTVFLLAGGVGGAMAYNGFFKARGLWGNVVRGALTGAAFVFGAMMAVRTPPLELLLFVVVFWAHDAASNLVGTLRDVAGDREGGYVTFAVRHGLRRAAGTAAALYALAVATAVAGTFLVPRDRAAYLLGILLAAVLGACAFRLLYAAGRALSSRTALRSHEVLVVERLVLAAALLVPGLGLPTALGLLVPVLVVTLTTQRVMRSRHEFSPDGRAHSADGPAAPPAFQH
ncbi:UbiA family prenyltransferase [Streptomyces sp. CB03238]|uniref:UbiA family prenyltransferase n=1 Tax=Streptomyces sp. CB03238 TaxID=1907777 RepID=UPI000A0FDD14|nr:UbiA family prenyltransferase [Streptomyces sp. CB03238]ORT57407.1 ubiquinone biosynthesis protein UbiA [Streptomyces sp. CB03238]DAC74156.1 TPA_exp: UbiA-type prenyltransferase [Streptomyces sp. CB03238]